MVLLYDTFCYSYRFRDNRRRNIEQRTQSRNIFEQFCVLLLAQ